VGEGNEEVFCRRREVRRKKPRGIDFGGCRRAGKKELAYWRAGAGERGEST